jgi:hypothetical protein
MGTYYINGRIILLAGVIGAALGLLLLKNQFTATLSLRWKMSKVVANWRRSWFVGSLV